MKRVKQVGLMLFMGLVIIGMSGCTSTTKTNEEESVMKDYATTYYNNHMDGLTGDYFQISVENLKSANDLASDADFKTADGTSLETYDLTKLSKCTDDSYVEIEINQDTKEIENYEFHLSCE